MVRHTPMDSIFHHQQQRPHHSLPTQGAMTMVCSLLKNCNGNNQGSVVNSSRKCTLHGQKGIHKQICTPPLMKRAIGDIDMTRQECWTYLDDEVPRGRFTAAWERGGVMGQEPSNTK